VGDHEKGIKICTVAYQGVYGIWTLEIKQKKERKRKYKYMKSQFGLV
jgi:uncharacterized protein YkuJ